MYMNVIKYIHHWNCWKTCHRVKFDKIYWYWIIFNFNFPTWVILMQRMYFVHNILKPTSWRHNDIVYFYTVTATLVDIISTFWGIKSTLQISAWKYHRLMGGWFPPTSYRKSSNRPTVHRPKFDHLILTLKKMKTRSINRKRENLTSHWDMTLKLGR